MARATAAPRCNSVWCCVWYPRRLAAALKSSTVASGVAYGFNQPALGCINQRGGHARYAGSSPRAVCSVCDGVATPPQERSRLQSLPAGLALAHYSHSRSADLPRYRNSLAVLPFSFDVFVPLPSFYRWVTRWISAHQPQHKSRGSGIL